MTTPPPFRKRKAAAVAALVAVSTAFATVTPVIADEPGSLIVNEDNSSTNPNPKQAAGLNIDDGSKLPAGSVKSEKELRDATDAIAKRMKQLSDEGTFDPATVYAAYKNPAALIKNEEGVLAALEDHYVTITILLRDAAQIQANATVSVDSALADDAAARKAAEMVRETLNGLTLGERLILLDRIREVNENNRTELDDIPDPYGADGVASYDEAWDFERIFKAHVLNIRDFFADKNENNYVDRDYAAAMLRLMENPSAKAVMAASDAAFAALVKAQLHDVITLHMFIDRARAQVQVLRLLQAQYAGAIRVMQLYENDTLQADKKTTVMDAYRDFFEGKDNTMAERFIVESQQLTEADENAKYLFKRWENDLDQHFDPKLDPEQQKYEEYRESSARQLYSNIIADQTWQNGLQRAQLIDRDAFGILEDKGKTEAAAAAAADAKAKIEALEKQVANQAAANDKINAALAEKSEKIGDLTATIDALKDKIDKQPAPTIVTVTQTPDPAPTETDVPTPSTTTNAPAPGSSPDIKANSSTGKDDTIKTLGILGLIAAIIGAIAMNFPAIAAMLPKM